ncbi:esterase-like activity of phytase family protein [Maridesulfovibrio bastinii]|uniref:esterase-like activity of phytase family protein n=1 Tax=Maridesulfovibrio bastinii TaxID=47157 RepID=UPI000414709A|nr:esterase-like activity of phytase family protein [Maridesulfovibrio bastinii]
MIKKLTFFSIPLLLCLCLAETSPAAVKEKNPIEVIISSSEINPTEQEIKNLNIPELKFMGAILLACKHPAFGGFSELMVSPDGEKFLALSDMGFWITGNLIYNAQQRLSGTAPKAKLGRLLNISGQPFEIKYRADSEAFCRAPDSGFLVAFERKHRINLYPGNGYDLSSVPSRYDFPPNFKHLPENGGIESMMKLDDGRILMLTEGGKEDNGFSPCAVGKAGNWVPFRYKRFKTYRPTSVAQLPGKRLLLLERSYTGPGSLKVRLATLNMNDIAKNKVLESKLMANIPNTLPIDNYEGLDTRTTSAGETIIYIISDDNFSPFEHTILMMFKLRKG